MADTVTLQSPSYVLFVNQSNKQQYSYIVKIFT